jgi:hypothetical protein
MRSGTIVCPRCSRGFEATAFEPPPPRIRAVEEVAASGPEGASACANHARNAAVTSCQRCGLFICSLCEMNVGGASYCPACFDLLRAQGSMTEVVTRKRDYASMARVTAIAGLFFSFLFLGLPFGILSLVYARKAFKQAKAEQRSSAGLWVVTIMAILEILGALALVAFLIVRFQRGFQ